MIERSVLRNVVDDVLTVSGPASARALEGDTGATDLWQVVVELGWPLVSIPEELGGVGGELPDLSELVEGVGRHTAAIPLIETSIALYILGIRGHRLDSWRRPATVAGLEPHDDVLIDTSGPVGRLRGSCFDVPWVGIDSSVVVIATPTDGTGHLAVLIDPESKGMDIRQGKNVAGEPRSTLSFDDLSVTDDQILGPIERRQVLLRASYLRMAALQGAMETAHAHTREHVTTRHQFGRPLVRFQAVSQQLAEAATATHISRLALQRALRALTQGDNALFHVAAARVVTGSAATDVARRAHQLHGAMGITREHSLHLATRRLWAWRDEWGAPHWWSSLVGDRVMDHPSTWLWDVTTGSVPIASETGSDPS